MPIVAQGKYYRENKLDGSIVLTAIHNPRRVLVEITTDCNLACQMCVRHQWNEPGGKMALDSFRRIVDLRRTYPTLEDLNFLGFGEPMVHPQFWEMVEEATAAGYRCHLVTNGSMLGPDAIRHMVKLRLASVFVSVDHPRRLAVEAGEGNREHLTAVDRVARPAEESRSVGRGVPIVGLAVVTQKSNVAELTELIDEAFHAGIRHFQVTNLLPHDASAESQTLYSYEERFLDIRRYAPDISIRLPEMRLRAERWCRFAHQDAIVIGWDGEVFPYLAFAYSYPCWIMGRQKSWLRHSFGNPFNQEFDSIWRSEAFVAFRAALARFDFPSCTDCGFRDGCGYTLDTEADCWGNTPSCGDCLWARGIIRCPGL